MYFDTPNKILAPTSERGGGGRSAALDHFKHFLLFPHSNMAAAHVSENHP